MRLSLSGGGDAPHPRAARFAEPALQARPPA
jgi:RHS repeat-associated protein